MNRGIQRVFLTIIALLLISFPSGAQELLSGKKASSVAGSIASNYKNWTTAGWSAKVKSDMLPVSVTAKTFMRRDSLTLISLRAPLVGEVARIEIDRNAITVVNKMKKRYAQMNIAAYGELATTLHSNIQDILIGRVTIIGEGTLSKSNCKDVDLYQVDDNTFLISATLNVGETSVNYGYAADLQGRILEMMATQGKPHTTSTSKSAEDDLLGVSKNMGVAVVYDKNKADADINISLGQRNYGAFFEGVEIEWNTKGFDRLNLRNYTRTNSISELLRF
ncbi:MAG: DUF4292 domain-containing protein [Muribaculaceae bacterium]|nr:DUF4292 domain-containing protein [Muribaculaceae bacterium]